MWKESTATTVPDELTLAQLDMGRSAPELGRSALRSPLKFCESFNAHSKPNAYIILQFATISSHQAGLKATRVK